MNIERDHYGHRALVAEGKLFGVYETFSEAVVAAEQQGLDSRTYIIPWIGVDTVILSYGR